MSKKSKKDDDVGLAADMISAVMKPARYIVAGGCAITCRHGVVGPGEEITADMLGGPNALNTHLMAGRIARV